MLLLQQMIILFLMMMIGYGLARAHMIDDKISGGLSAIVVNVANPCLILNSGFGQDKGSDGGRFLTSVILAFLMYAALMLVAEIVPRLIRADRDRYGTYKVMTIFSNIGFMGIPVIAAVYGQGSVLYTSPFILLYNVLIYTYGIRALCGTGRKMHLRQLVNLGNIACVAAILGYLLGLSLPGPLAGTSQSLANLNAPLSMIVIGYSLSKMDLKKLFFDRTLLIFSVIKLLILPIIGIFLIRIFVKDSIVLGVAYCMLSTPVGSMNAMLAQQYHGDFELASKGVAVTTILSVITMPLISALMGV